MQKYKVYINNECKIITDNWYEFMSKYTVIVAAGGLVYNTEGHLLMILRDNKWDLPKGKLEPYENIKDCAIREVKEECGVSNLQIVSELISTYHTYIVNSKSILKRTYWFKMQTNYNNKLTPQFNEGITKAEWVSKKNVAEKLTNSFGNIKDLLEK
jgi:8-oxo-dGTP pyrophosphatase MutT (NUDIX family)